MRNRLVCAVVVTFHPQREVLDNLRLLHMEIDHIVVVDNTCKGSVKGGNGGLESLQMLREASLECGFTLLENGSNLGIAAALNRGVRWADGQGYEWVLFFDQDSTVEPGFADAVYDGYERHPRREGVAICCPKYVDRASRLLMDAAYDDDGGLLVARTSGSLMPMWIFKQCGRFVEEMIIDQVDYEYSLRVRKLGYHIAECPAATLIHSLGSPKTHRLWGLRLFGTSNHNAARRYYLVRNRVWLMKQYWRRYPSWCASACFATLKETVKILLVEECRWSKLAFTGIGIRDGAIGRMGMVVEL